MSKIIISCAVTGAILQEPSLEVATPAEARALLKLKGQDPVSL